MSECWAKAYSESEPDCDEVVRLRAVLQQIKDVCEDNSSVQCNAHMALNFVWGVADNALNNEQADESQ